MHTAQHVPAEKVRSSRFSSFSSPATACTHKIFILPSVDDFFFPFRKRAASKSSNGSHKYKGTSKDLKPPDLWIHHERLELKPMDKSPEPNPVMTETPIPRTSQDITPADSGLESNSHLQQRRNSYRGRVFFCFFKGGSLIS